MTAIAPHITAFFQERLTLERRASIHTCDSYAYAFQLLLTYASKRLNLAPSRLQFEQIDAPLVVSFLNDLESTRSNGASSRNVRLAAIKSFMHFMEYRLPAALEQIRRILAIPMKKTDTRLVRHLSTRYKLSWTRRNPPIGLAFGTEPCCTCVSPADCAYPSSPAFGSRTCPCILKPAFSSTARAARSGACLCGSRQPRRYVRG